MNKTQGRLRITMTVLIFMTYATIAVCISSTDRGALTTQSDSSTDSLGEVLLVVWMTALISLAIAAFATRRHRPHSRITNITIGCCVALSLFAGGFGTVRTINLSTSGFFGTLQQQEQAKAADVTAQKATLTTLAASLQRVCGGYGVDGTAQLGNDIRPLIIIDENAKPYAADQTVSRGWGAKSLQELHAVVCMEAEKSDTQSCDYTGGTSFSIKWYSRMVWIVSAAKGDQLAVTTLDGKNGSCPEAIAPGSDRSDRVGDHVTTDQILDFVSSNLPLPKPTS